jgi:hypothetical protein
MEGRVVWWVWSWEWEGEGEFWIVNDDDHDVVKREKRENRRAGVVICGIEGVGMRDKG